MVKVTIRRVYDPAPPEEAQRYRILIDRLWPRGIRKDDLHYDAWEKELAPSVELRKWFGHSPERWPEFRERYRQELASTERQNRLQSVIAAAGGRAITLLYGARDPQHNHALILAEAFERLY